MELWRLPPVAGQQIVNARNKPPSDMSINEKVAWKEGFDAGFGLFLRVGVCLLPDDTPVYVEDSDGTFRRIG